GDVAPSRELIALLAVLASALAIGLPCDRAVAALRLADAAGREDEIDRAERVLHAVRVMLDASGVEEKAGACRSPPLRRLPERSLGDTGPVRRPRGCPLVTVARDILETDGQVLDELVIEPIVLDHQVEHSGEERRVAAGPDRQIQVAGARNRRNARIL